MFLLHVIFDGEIILPAPSWVSYAPQAILGRNKIKILQTKRENNWFPTAQEIEEIILKDKNVKAVLINIFGGIVRCDRVANGVVQAVNDLGLDVPVVVRLEGTNAEIAKEILSNSNVEIIPANNLQDAANKVVNVAIKEKN